MKKIILLMVLIVGFGLGFISSAYLIADTSNYETPLSPILDREKLSPYDIIKEDQIKVYKDRVVIYIDNPKWAAYTDTNSMDPLIDKGANGLEFVPQSPNEIHIGDIATYQSDEGLIVHRVIDKNIDEEGNTWYLFKGDNNSLDDGWIEFKDIKYVTWGIIY